MVVHSRILGETKIRREEFLREISVLLDNFIGTKQTIILLLSLIVIFGISNIFVFSYNELISLISSFLIGYVVLVWTFFASRADIQVGLEGTVHEKDIFKKNAAHTVNKITLGFPFIAIGLILFLNLTLLDPIIQVVMLIVWGAGAFFLWLSQFTFTWKLANDLRRIFGALAGHENYLDYTTENLVLEITEEIKKRRRSNQLSITSLRKMRSLAEIDLGRAEFRIELSNIALAATAVISSILFSDLILGGIEKTIIFIDSIIIFLSSFLVESIAAPSNIENIFFEGIRFGIWWALGSWIFAYTVYAVRWLASNYFGYYRPAHALFQALFIYEDEDGVV